MIFYKVEYDQFFFELLLCVTTEKWSPALQIRTVLLSIQALLSAPNPDDPLANDVAEQWKANESAAISTGLFCHYYVINVFLSVQCDLVLVFKHFLQLSLQDFKIFLY